MKVAVVWNRSRDGIINNFGQPCPEKYGKKTIMAVVDAIRNGGHEVALFEADLTLLPNLLAYMPPDQNGQPTGVVFNLAYEFRANVAIRILQPCSKWQEFLIRAQVQRGTHWHSTKS